MFSVKTWGSLERTMPATPLTAEHALYLVDGKAIKSCTMLGVQANGKEILTIEGITKNGELHPLQKQFH